MSLQIDYREVTVHKHMLGDRIRCEAFRRALAALVKPDSVVLDVGAGTGLLSLFAAQAGATTVYAVERTSTAKLARTIVARNGFAECIRIFEDDIVHVVLPETVDIIVSEFLGGCGLDENLLPAVVIARDHWLKPGGQMIPNRVSSWMAPACDNLLDSDLHFWNTRPYGVDLTDIGLQTAKQVQPCRYNVLRHHLLSEPQAMWEIDINRVTFEESLQTFRADLSFVIQRSGRCNSLATWFEADLGGGVMLSNEPSMNYTHWGRWVLPIGTSLPLAKGTRMDVQFRIEPEQIGRAKVWWSIHVGDYTFSSDDVTILRSAAR